MPRLVAALLTLAKNAVPAAGVLLREWAAPGALLLYLGENVTLVLLAAMTFRVALPESQSRTDALKTFFLVAVPFTFGAAVFTGAVILIREEYRVAPRELASGLATMAVFQLLAFALGLRRARGKPQAELEVMLSDVLGRVFLLAFAVWAGLLLAFFVSNAFVIPFIVLKTIVDIGSLFRRRVGTFV